MSLPPLPIRSGQGDYQVHFPSTLEELVTSMLEVRNAVVVADRNVASRYGKQLAPLLETRPLHLITPTEEEKSPVGAVKVWEFLQGANATKQTQVIVIGGGIVQDLAQFSCHNYYRGLRWHFAPTTLLSQADSCIGAKCGINLGAFKNQLGVFHSPSQVWICAAFLDSLSDTEVRSGYGEILKLHLTRSDASLFRELASELRANGWRNPLLARFIRQSLEVKKGVIEEDEYEKDLRRILNYGHTFGHALEAITHHAIPHGMAVAWGMDLVNFIALRRGLISQADFEEVHTLVDGFFSWSLPAPVTAEQLIEGTRRDKKVSDGKLNLILPDRLGGLRIVPCAYDSALQSNVEEYLATNNALRWN